MRDMAYQYQIENTGKYIRVEISGSRKPEHAVREALDVWAVIAETAQSLGQQKVLYLSHICGSIPVMEAYDVVDQFVNNDWTHLKIAYIDLVDSDEDDLMMLKAICFQHEIQFEFFDNEEQGQDWLNNLDDQRGREPF
ncbi:hypothetical protein ACMXYW_01135 [Neptuniibacter sp. QD48_55]|uniref:hypothetical protein n=1 Tax=Neptuniibacter sp. QD48_55 TaxID=3398212 RepID=UPI0039F45DB2